MSAKRLFVSLNLPDAIADALVRLDPHSRGVRWLHPEQLHLTLAFLGTVGPERETKLRENLERIRFGAFFLPLGGLGTFPAKGPPRIIWLGVGHGHPHLFQLHKLVTDAALAAQLEPDLRPWHPHITLARCERISRGTLQGFLREQAEFSAGLVRFDHFTLQSSRLARTGPIYSVELEVGAAGT